MSEVELQDLVIRMATDAAFAENVRMDPAGALGGFDLTPDEIGQLTSLTGDSAGGVQGLATRQSKSGLLFMGAHPTQTDTSHLAAGPPVMDHAAPVADAPVVHTPVVHVDTPVVHDAPPPPAPTPVDHAPQPADVNLHDPAGLRPHDGPDVKLHAGDVKVDDFKFHLKIETVGDKTNIAGARFDPTPGGPPSGHDGGAVISPDVKLHDIGDVKLHHIGEIKIHGDPQPADHGPGVETGGGHAGSGEFWGPDGMQPLAGSIDNTSTGQAYYIDGQGHGHAFYPGGGDPGAAPAPHAMVDAGGRFMGVDGQVHHVGYDPAQVPDHVTVSAEHMGKVGGLDKGGGQYYGPDGQLHHLGNANLNIPLYSAVELASLLRECGFASTTVYGDLQGRPYDQEAALLVAVARTPG